MALVTNDVAFGNPSSALGLVAWTDAWPGDIYVFAPGLDSNSNVGAGSAGTLGGSSAKIGLTVNGPTGDIRTFVLFVPSDALERIYGTGVTSGDITGYVNGTQVSTAASSDNSTFTADGVAVTGVRLSFDYTFASATDNSVGVVTAGSSDSGCFIATAAYGSSLEPRVVILRELRDQHLLKTSAGKGLVGLYEICSPPLARFISKHETLRAVARWGLMPFVGVGWLTLRLGPMPILVMLLLFLASMSATIILYRRKAKR